MSPVVPLKTTVPKEPHPFNYLERRSSPYGVISQFDFEHLQSPSDPRARLGLALYRDGLGSDNEFYRFLSFYKVVNILFELGPDQKAWINKNVGKVVGYSAVNRLEELQASDVSDLGDYLYKQGRNAIAHAFATPVRDPDDPIDRAVIKQDTDLMRGVAEVAIEDELGVPSIRRILREHLFELEGFKRILGDALAARIKAREDIPLGALPGFPPLTIALREKPPYVCFQGLSPTAIACANGGLVLATEATPLRVALMLDFSGESIELLLQSLQINKADARYSREVEASVYRFLIDYFMNGRLQVFNAATGDRLGHKAAFIPVNIDVPAQVRDWETRIQLLQSVAETP